MKLLRILPLLLLISFFSNAQQKITVKTTLENPDQTVLLAHYYGYKQFIKVDSAKLDNGLLQFEAKEEPWKGGLYLLVVDNANYYDFVISGDEDDLYFEFEPDDYIGTVKFKNSPENDTFFGYRSFLTEKSLKGAELQSQIGSETDPVKAAKIREDLDDLQKEINEGIKERGAANKDLFASKLMLANLEPELSKEPPLLADGRTDSTYFFRTYKNHYFDYMEMADERMIRTPFLESKIEKYFNNLVFQRSDSLIKDSDYVLGLTFDDKDVYRYVLWYITNKYETTDIVGLDGIIIHLYENHYLKNGDWLDDAQRERFEERLATIKPLETGKIMPPLILKDLDGSTRDLYDVKAKYTIVYFYSPTCGHCKDSAPALEKYQEEHKDKGVVVWNIAADQERDDSEMRKFIKDFKMNTVTNLSDPDRNYDFYYRYDVYATPTLYILDEDKHIIAKRIPVEELENYIEHYEKNVKGK